MQFMQLVCPPAWDFKIFKKCSRVWRKVSRNKYFFCEIANWDYNIFKEIGSAWGGVQHHWPLQLHGINIKFQIDWHGRFSIHLEWSIGKGRGRIHQSAVCSITDWNFVAALRKFVPFCAFFFELLILGEDKQVYGPYEIRYAIIGCLTAFFATLWPFVVNFCDHLSSAPAKEFEKMDKDWWC